MCYGRQYLLVRCFPSTRALEQRISNPLFHSLSTSMATATLRDFIWKKVDINPLEQQQTWQLLLLLALAQPLRLRCGGFNLY